jgi:acetyl esterase
MKSQSYLTAVFACLSALVALVNHQRGEVDLISFAVAKFTYAVFPENFPKNDSVDPAKWRARVRAASRPLFTKPQVSFIDIQHDGVVAGDSRLIRVYNYNSTAGAAPRDVLIFYYGGGFVVGCVEENDGLYRTMAKETNFVIVAVEYSLAPEFPYPRALHDSMAALHWTRDNIAQYGGNPDRVFVGGESAGGKLAAAVTARNLDTEYVAVENRVNVIGTLLVYPGTSGNFSLPSFTKYATYNGILTTQTVKHVLSLYRGGVDYDTSEYGLLPLYTPAHILAQFPPTEVVVAEYDCLRDDSLKLVERLRAVKAPVHMTMYRRSIHGFFGRDLFPEGHKAVVQACKVLKNIAATGNL